MTYIEEIISMFAEAEGSIEDLFFHTKPELKVFAMCSDWFAWAYTDLEEITPEDLPLLRECFETLKPYHKDERALWYLGEYYASRKRKLAPLKLRISDWEKGEDHGMPTKNPEENKKPNLARLMKACGPSLE